MIPGKPHFPMLQVFKKVRKIFGRDLAPQKIAARVPRLFWINALAEWLLGQKAGSATAADALDAADRNGVGCPF